MAIDELSPARTLPRRSQLPPTTPPASGRGGDPGPQPRHHQLKRADIQGLRAVAVVLVVLNHLTGWPGGGFVGVDVFFVISGYLITGLLLRDATSRSGRRGPWRVLGRFYWRRVTRLLPASLTVTIVTLVGASLLFNSARAADTLRDAVWATGFLANNHFAAIGTDYFAANRAVSPFQHYWSLSVEEQFYVVWPVVLLGVVLLSASRRARRGREYVGPALIALPALATLASFAWAVHLSGTSATAAYFSTPARAWELGLGATVACAQPSLRPGRRGALALSLLGTAAVGVAAFVIGLSSGLPTPGALLPCLGAAACVAAVTATGTGARNPLLTNRVATRIGDLSYSLYLVHFPIVVLLGTVVAPKSGIFYLAAVLLIGGASTVLHEFVELPGMSLGKRALRPRLASGALTVGASALAVIALALAVMTLAPNEAVTRTQRFDAVQAAMNRSLATSAAPRGPQETRLASQVRAALATRTWPTLTPTLAEESNRSQVPGDMQQCGAIDLRPASQCTFGDRSAPHTMYLVGDSTAAAYAAAYRKVVSRLPGWRLRVASAYGCDYSSVVVRNANPVAEMGCAAHNAAVTGEIARTRPDVVLVTNSYAARTSSSTGALLTESEWSTALDVQLQRLPRASRVVLVEPAPQAADPYSCARPGSEPIDCVAQIPLAHQSRAIAERSLAATRSWTYIGTESWFCDPASGYCPIFAAGVPIRHDDLHLTYAYDDVIGPVVLESLQTAGVLR